MTTILVPPHPGVLSAAGLLAAGISHFFLLGKVFKIRTGDNTYYRNLGDATFAAPIQVSSTATRSSTGSSRYCSA